MALDIATGILFSLLVSHIYSLDLTTQFLICGIIFNLLPDLDASYYFLKKREGNHRDLFHKPIIFIVLGLGLYFYNQPLSLLFILTTMAHLIHDSIAFGWGVQWLWPISQNHYAFFYLYSPPHKKIPRKLIYVWKHEDLPGVVKEYGDNDWFRNIYLKLHPAAVIELLSLVVVILILVRYFS